MLNRTALIALFGATALAMAAAQSTLTVPAPKTQANDGKQMFVSYCAPCHGVDGRGQGPVTPALVTKPVDLTRLAKNNSGKFPETHVLAVIEFGSAVEAHGVKDMPVWGPVLNKMDGSGASHGVSELRQHNLEEYVKSLQAN